MNWPTPVELRGDHAVLTPLSQDHRDDLIESVGDGELWRLWYTSIPRPEAMEQEIARRLSLRAAGSMLPFAVIAPWSGRAVGMTTYMNIDATNRRLEIGSTWYRKAVQRSPLNTECKLMLLRHAFDELDCIAVEFRTHFMNQQSRTAIERLGARLDGVLRNHQRMPNGSPRDTCVYSILPHEWPSICAHLEAKLRVDGA